MIVESVILLCIGVCRVFLLTSNAIVHRPGSSFSDIGVTIPSLHVTGCCGLPGSFPVITIYATDEFGFLFIPINIIMASFLAFLVGVNLSIVALKLKFHSSSCCALSFNAVNNREKEKEEKERVKKKGIGLIKQRPKIVTGVGLMIGLFACCPACAGNIYCLIL